MPVTFDDLLHRAAALSRPGRRALLGIAGCPGAGKTTLAERLTRALNGDGEPWVAHVPMDGFHLADVELDRLGRRDRKGAPDTFDAVGYAALLERLRRDEDDVVYAPGFERTLEQPVAGAIPVPPSARLIVTEGNYLLMDEGPWARVRSRLDEVWFCDLDETERYAGSSPGTRSSARGTRRRSPGSTVRIGATRSRWRRAGVTPTWWCRRRRGRWWGRRGRGRVGCRLRAGSSPASSGTPGCWYRGL